MFCDRILQAGQKPEEPGKSFSYRALEVVQDHQIFYESWTTITSSAAATVYILHSDPHASLTNCETGCRCDTDVKVYSARTLKFWAVCVCLVDAGKFFAKRMLMHWAADYPYFRLEVFANCRGLPLC